MIWNRKTWVFAEGMLVDDDGTLTKTYAVHLGQAADLNRTGFVGGSVYWFPTSAQSACWAL